MSAQYPNHVHMQRGEICIGFDFGNVRSLTPIHFAGNGHNPYVQARFDDGLRVDWTPAALVTLIKAAREALGRLPKSPDFSDAVWGEDS